MASQDKTPEGEVLGHVVAVVLAWDGALLIPGSRTVEWMAFECLSKWKWEAQRSPMTLRLYGSQRPPWWCSRKPISSLELCPFSMDSRVASLGKVSHRRALFFSSSANLLSHNLQTHGKEVMTQCYLCGEALPQLQEEELRCWKLSLQTKCSHMVPSQSWHWLRLPKRMVIHLVPISAYVIIKYGPTWSCPNVKTWCL